MSALFEATRAVDFERLYRRHAPSVYRYTYAVLGNHADAEDLTQQTFLNAYRACSQGTKPRKAENWLLRIAHNEVRRHFRDTQRTRQEVELSETVAQPPAERSDPSLADVLRALRRLPPIQRSALVLREFEGRSYAEIAEILGMTRSALEAQTFRARRALAEQLEDAFTCSEAEEAVLRRLDARLPRRVARRLKEHLHDCRACVRFADVQKRQRAVLRTLSLLPIPASLFLFRVPGATAGGGAAAGTAGIASGVVAKAAAVTAAAAVAGGVGYGVAAGPDAAPTADRKSAPAPAAAPPSDVRLPTQIGRTRIADAEAAPVGPALAHSPREVRARKASRKKAAAGRSVEAGANEVGTTRATKSLGHKAQPGKRAWGKTVRPSRPAHPQPLRRPTAAKKPSSARGAKPASPPQPRANAQPGRGSEKPKLTTPSPGTNNSGGAADPGSPLPGNGNKSEPSYPPSQ
jgi:RNA polymerase sigma factor (sigma-70 family)